MISIASSLSASKVDQLCERLLCKEYAETEDKFTEALRVDSLPI